MYIGQYKRNGQVKADEIPLSQVLIQQINSNDNEDKLTTAKKQYKKENHQGYYKNANSEKWYNCD